MLENIITVLVHSPAESQNLQSFTSILANCYLINYYYYYYLKLYSALV